MAWSISYTMNHNDIICPVVCARCLGKVYSIDRNQADVIRAATYIDRWWKMHKKRLYKLAVEGISICTVEICIVGWSSASVHLQDEVDAIDLRFYCRNWPTESGWRTPPSDRWDFDKRDLPVPTFIFVPVERQTNFGAPTYFCSLASFSSIMRILRYLLQKLATELVAAGAKVKSSGRSSFESCERPDALRMGPRRPRSQEMENIQRTIPSVHGPFVDRRETRQGESWVYRAEPCIQRCVRPVQKAGCTLICFVGNRIHSVQGR